MRYRPRGGFCRSAASSGRRCSFATRRNWCATGASAICERVEVGLPGDPAGGDKTPMPRPDGFNYEMWLGETPYVYYTVDRVHPQQGYDRPGWLRCRQFGAGMITGWGAHHIDSAHWGMNTEYTGPVEIWGHAEFPDHGLWDVHGPFKTEANYARMTCRPTACT